MALFTISPELLSPLQRALSEAPAGDGRAPAPAAVAAWLAALDDVASAAVHRLLACCRSLLKSDGFAAIKGLPVDDGVHSLLGIGAALGPVFDDPAHQSGAVINASPSIESTLQGNQTEPLFLHTDFAMLERPPAVTIIQCVRPDPLGLAFGTSGFVVARDLVSRHFGSSLLADLFGVRLPFGGRTPAGEDLVFEAPILSPPDDDSQLVRVRFHPSRIHHGFRLRGGPPGEAETRLLRRFQRIARAARAELALAPGDFLLLNNRCALHDRSRCTFELGGDSVRSRAVRILFVQELAANAAVDGG